MDHLLQKATELAQQGSTPYLPIPNRVAYVVSHGQSYASNGYAIRTQGVAKALNQHGLETLCFSRPGHPWDLGVEKGPVRPEVIVDGVRYIHSRWPNDKAPGTESRRLQVAADRLEQLFKIYRPKAVLASSNFEVGLPAWVAAQRLGLPFYNEVRDSLDLQRTAQEPNLAGASCARKEESERDIFVAKQADKVFIQGKVTKLALLHRGVPSHSIEEMPGSFSNENCPTSTVYPLFRTLKGAPSSESSAELKISEKVSLTSNPIWYDIAVEPQQQLIIKAAVQYKREMGQSNRKAVLLLKSFNTKGEEVDKPCGRMAKSGHLKAYFKYLSCTQSKLQEVHEFSVPAGVTQIKVGLCGFNKSSTEIVTVENLSVGPKPYKSKPSQFVPPSKQAAEISILGWPDYPPNGKPYVMGIMDEFTTGCFEQDLNLIQPRPDNWYALAEKYKPELFFIESAWKGNYGSWQYRVAEYANKPGHEVAHITQYAKEKGIPTLFWNKEDPVHHKKFMGSAKLVDHIFTTDANMRDSYRVKTGNDSVHALPFAAQPALHKPKPLAGRLAKSCFAGSWYGNRHAERGQAMRWLLQAANKYGLEIYDRNHGTGIFPFPEEYQKGIKGSLPYKELCDEYSRYRVFLNVNSVTDSPTMFSRRVFELMACGTPVVSTYAKGIDNLFESDAVWMVHSQEEADEAIHTLITDDAEWRRRSLAGIREVFAKHTYAHRLNDIFERLGIESRMPTDPAILLVAEAYGQGDLDALNHFARKQHYRQFRLGIECPQGIAAMAGSLSDNIVLLQPGGKAGWVAKQQTDYPIAGWLSPSSHYGEHYLRDLANASLYEPGASGWAKAPKEDLFAYGQQAALCGALWKTAEFLKHSINAKPDAILASADLFLADSDQFQHGGLAQQQVVGG